MTAPLDDSGRCVRSELLPDQCGCQAHRNSELNERLRDVRFVRYTDAMWDGVCALDETHPIEVGERIGKTQHGWACNRCVRDAKAIHHG